MNRSSKPTWQHLLETGILVQFHILDTTTEPSPDNENLAVRADIIFTSDDDDTTPADVAEWGTFGFLYTLASLSFNDARPRGYSDTDFLAEDEFGVGDLLECLSYCNGEIQFRADYIRGRCMKTDITVRPDGTVALATWGRGTSALRWLHNLRGKKTVGLVQ